MSVCVQTDDFDLSAEIAVLRQGRIDIGAVCSFIGCVRDGPLTLESYPAMAHKSLEAIEAEATALWPARHTLDPSLWAYRRYQCGCHCPPPAP